MSFNIVKSKKSTVLVEKYRDRKTGKVTSKYLMSLGIQTEQGHRNIRESVHGLAQEHRIDWCMKSGYVTEVPKSIPRRKAPTGDKRKPKAKKPKKTAKKLTKQQTAKKTGNKLITHGRPVKQSVAFKPRKQEGMKVSRFKTITEKKAYIDKRISSIKGDVITAKKVIKQKKGVRALSRTHALSIKQDIAYNESIIENAPKAIRILQKQKSQLRR